MIPATTPAGVPLVLPTAGVLSMHPSATAVRAVNELIRAGSTARLLPVRPGTAYGFALASCRLSALDQTRNSR